MSARPFLLVSVYLLAVAAACAQAPFQMDESKLSAVFKEGNLIVNLPLQSAQRLPSVNVRLEILDEYDKTVAKSETTHALNVGATRLTVPIAVAKDLNNLLWHRLRCVVAQPDSPNIVENIFAISEIMPEIFELHVTAPPTVYPGMRVRTHVLALHPYTKRPVRNVTIAGNFNVELDTDADEDELDIKSTGKTNAEGIATIEFRIPQGIKIDHADLEVKGRKNGVEREADTCLDNLRDKFVYLYTDKPIYQPNQKLYVRGLYLDATRRPVAGAELEIEIENEEGDTVLEKTVVTSRFGVANLEWQIPPDFKLGKYTIEVENDNSDDIGSAQFKVSRYDLPNFAVNAKAAKPFYLLNEPAAEVTVDAAYLFGKPVKNGKVKIVEEHERTWNFARQEYDTEQGAAYEGDTNADGRFSASVNLAAAIEKLKADQWKRFADLKFAAYFTDATTMRTEQRRFDIRITKEPIHLYFIRPAADPNPAVPFQFYVSAFYADGSPAKTSLTVSGYYDNADTNETLATQRTNSFGAAKFELNLPEKPFPEAKDQFNLRIAATDSDGRTGSFNENLYVGDKDQIRVKTDKTIYAPEQPITVKVLSTRNGPAFVDVSKDSSVVWSKQVSVRDGAALLAIPYRPDFKGELSVTAYFYDEGDSDFGFQSKTVIYPSPAVLDLNLKSVKAAYRPGEDARLAFNVRGGSGFGTESALGIVIFDKAIEERARVEQLPDNMSDLRKLLGTAEAFGELTRKDLDKIDTSKPISNDLQLAAEYLLTNKSTRPRWVASNSYLDDFGSKYRSRMRLAVEPLFAALRKRHEETFDYPKNESELAVMASRSGLDLNAIRDAWNTPFQPEFRKNRGDLILELRSASADKKFGTSDDFAAGEISFQWFAPTLDRLRKSTGIELADGPKPPTADHMRALIMKAGIDLNSITDPWGRPVQISTRNYSRGSIKSYLETVSNLDGAKQEVLRSKAVQQEIAMHSILSTGEDGIMHSWDDFTLGSFIVVLSEKDIITEGGKIVISKGTTSNNRGAIGGTVTDANGAVVPGARVQATNVSSQETFHTETNDEGFFILANLPSGKYQARAESPGFRVFVVENVVVSAYNLVKLDITLDVGNVDSVVEITSGVELTTNASFSALSTSVTSTSVTRSQVKSISTLLGGNQPYQTFTPRVREYFPETLVWQPELITDKNGRASLDFKMADSLTTWKLYAFGSTEAGEFGFVEKEIQTFQPFFAELDPPKILTEGDEISLPVPVRNYTSKRQRVAVSMEPNAWSKMPNGASKQIEIAPNDSQNAVFDFVAASPVKDGKQRVSALAGSDDGDAIEKTVTVKPNGREETRVQSTTFQKSAAFDVDFPTDAFQANRSAVLKIYPNMLAHVAESVEGLLQRPHGCGEQTTSSTYPNLMILKIEKDFGKPIDANLKEQAKTYLADGYKRLLGYQTPSGGFSYWGPSDTPNPALTAYIVRFLSDADEFIDVDKTVLRRAKEWLENQQKLDGSWSYSGGATEAETAYIVRSLLHGDDKDSVQSKRISDGLAYLGRRLDQSNDPYVIANTALIAAKLGDRTIALEAFRKLIETARTKDEQTSWPANSTPFYGWGLTAEIETTAIALRALSEFNKRNEIGLSNIGTFTAGALKFLLANKDGYGVWYSTQTTVNVLETLIGLHGVNAGDAAGGQNLVVLVNGNVVKEFPIASASLGEPVRIDLGRFLTQNANRIEIKGTDANVIGAHLAVNYYSDWTAARPESRFFDLKVSYDKTTARIGEEITCTVEMRRKSYTRYGMVLTEIGIPPGADVDRKLLEAAKTRMQFSSYDILPDKVLVYSWNDSAPLAFSFKFKQRYGINALTAPSVVYDYYNPEAQATAAPVRFSVK